jgi:Rieske Fe-S protein
MTKSSKVLIATIVCMLLTGFVFSSPLLQLFYHDAEPFKFFGYQFTAEFEPIVIASVKDVPEGTGHSFSVKLDLPYAGPQYVRQDIYGMLTNIDGEFHAYSAVCPHLGCIVRWDEEQVSEKRIWCNCHNGAFDPTTGDVTEGPPPRGLPVYTVMVDGDDIYLESIEEGAQ